MDIEHLVKQAQAMQQAYWTPNAREKADLMRVGVERLDWSKTLRLLHLACLDLITTGPAKAAFDSGDIEEDDGSSAAKGDDVELVKQLFQKLNAPTSPYQPRRAFLWKGKPGESDQRPPDLQGVLRNASLTHLGCIEIIRLEGQEKPKEVAFIPFDDLRGALFAPAGTFRFGKLFFETEAEDEMVLAPLLYGISFRSKHAWDKDGTMTRFVCHMHLEAGKMDQGIGVGHQDFVMEGSDNQTLFGFSTIGELMMALTLDDPKFEQKCRARGLDPDQVRQSVKRK